MIKLQRVHYNQQNGLSKNNDKITFDKELYFDLFLENSAENLQFLSNLRKYKIELENISQTQE